MQGFPDAIEIRPVRRPVLDLEVPGSKSLTNRAQIVAALADGRSRLEGALVAEDSLVMQEGLRRLGFTVEAEGDAIEIVGGGGSVPSGAAELDLRLSGTSIRFLAALVALGNGTYRLDGNARMRERPIEDLLSALRSLGVDATSERGNGCPPAVIRAAGLDGGAATVAGDRSSQFLSALLMVGPGARAPLTLEVTGELQSKPFVDMTLRLMAEFGVEVERDGYRLFTVRPQRYGARRYGVEGDAMAAGYFWAAAAITGGRVRVRNLPVGSVQGDARLVEVLSEMGCEVEWDSEGCRVAGPGDGCLRGGTFDLNDMPDQAQTLAVVALFADAPVEIVNVPNLRIKETDRLSAMAVELAKLGAHVEEHSDGLVVHPLERPRPAAIDTYGDHRMAMAFALAGLRVPGVVIRDPACVEKTYPRYFEDLARLGSHGVEL